MFDPYQTPQSIRSLIRKNEITTHTAKLAPGYVQANVVILPKNTAFDFLLFCQRNPKPCPVLEVLDEGSSLTKYTADKADLKYDVPKYRIYKDGELEIESNNLEEYWRSDFVTFLLGCSFTFDSALISAGIEIRNITQSKNVPMYVTNIPTSPAGIFSGPTVVSMRPIPKNKIVRAVQVTSRFPSVHGSPIQIGDSEKIGIKDVFKPDFGDPTDILDDEVPVFWVCGVTPQAVAMEAKLPLMITHAPGHMFLTDLKNEDLSVI
ncbi:uncharacterized protein METZ01_LOCUS238192 [marine metagenome]|uniref:DUF1445 domain-containing protein n=1 Tax=marine metagenome TaxID=408172 RepID=A0A382HDE9_9ZZZZ